MHAEVMLPDFRRSLVNPVCVIISFIGLFVFAASAAVADDSKASEKAEAAQVVIESLHDALVATAADSSLSFDERYEKLAPVVTESHDFDFISRFVLRRSWSKLEPAQREKFIDTFQRLSITNYASRFANIKERSLAVTGVRGTSGKRLQVDALLQTAELNVNLSYTLKALDESWAIINVVADGVSDLALRRAEYSQVLKKQGFDGLIRRLDGQIADLQ